MVTVVEIGACRVRIFPETQYLETVWPDGADVPASPEINDRYLQTAVRLGYGFDGWAMCRAHELLHSWLAVEHGEPRSPTLRGVAIQQAPAVEVWAAEENRVLALQALLNGAGVSADDRAALADYALEILVSRAGAWLASIDGKDTV